MHVKKPFGDSLQFGGVAWPQTSLFTVPLHAAALPLLAALAPLPFREEEQPSPQPKNSSGGGHFDVASSYKGFSLYHYASGKNICFGLEDIAKQCNSVVQCCPRNSAFHIYVRKHSIMGRVWRQSFL